MFPSRSYRGAPEVQGEILLVIEQHIQVNWFASDRGGGVRMFNGGSKNFDNRAAKRKV
jgi:hypothetical protein